MKVVVYGTEDCASLAHFYLNNDSNYKVVAFTVDSNYIKEENFENKPIVAFEELETEFPPNDFYLFAPLYSNNLRFVKYCQGIDKGYKFIKYIHSSCIVYSAVGENCFILERNIIQPYVTFGKNNIMWTNNHIGHHSWVADHCFFASHVVICGHCKIHPFCWLGSNCAVKENTVLNMNTTLGMSAALIKDSVENSTYKGVPATC